MSLFYIVVYFIVWWFSQKSVEFICMIINSSFIQITPSKDFI